MDDWGKGEYTRADLGEFVRGKYAKRIRESTNVVVLDPHVAKFFPNDKAVNEALRKLLPMKKAQANKKSKVTPNKRAA